MEEIEFKPPHCQKSTIIKEDDMDVHVPEQHSQYLPRVNHRADGEGIGDKFNGVSIDVDCAKECAYVGV
jgi:hypothetical protein